MSQKTTNKITIMDGGMGGELKAMGAPFKKPEWSALALMEAPETVTQAHLAFVDAGAEILITNTYAIVPFHIGQERFDKDAATLTRDAAKIARHVADGATHNVKVAGSLPPAFGSYRPDLFAKENNTKKSKAIYTPLIEQQKNFIDFWLAETMSSTAEAKLLADMIKDKDKDFWLAYSLTDDVTPNQPATLRSGESIEQAIETALEINADALLFNCSQPEVMGAALQIVQKSNITIPYGVYANTFPPKKPEYFANEPENDVQMREDITPEEYLRYAQEWVALGATIIGGCCGIGPAHIAKLAKLND